MEMTNFFVDVVSGGKGSFLSLSLCVCWKMFDFLLLLDDDDDDERLVVIVYLYNQ